MEKPGYPNLVALSKAAAIRTMAAENMPRKAIAARLGISENHVHSSLSRDRSAGRAPVVSGAGERGSVAATLETVAEDGSLTLSAELIARVGAAPGEKLVTVVGDGFVRIVSAAVLADRIGQT